jgi:predicted DNA binding CopG/RHH family protein
MKKNQSVFDIKLDAEEREILRSVEAEEWVSVKSPEKAKKEAKEAASNYLLKNARVNLRISDVDLAQLKQKAAHKGMPYQTFIASILHEFAAGHFKS